MHSQPTDRDDDRELKKLREHVLALGARVEEMIADAMRALINRDAARARRAVVAGYLVDRMELEIHESCVRILARRHPIAADFQTVMATLKHVTDLERIGDLVVNMCERVAELASAHASFEASAVERIGAVAQDMLHDALSAFEASDVVKAERVIERDRMVDAYYAQLFPELVTTVMSDPRVIDRAAFLQSIGKCLERIADHATNLAEGVVFMVHGKDARHHADKPA